MPKLTDYKNKLKLNEFEAANETIIKMFVWGHDGVSDRIPETINEDAEKCDDEFFPLVEKTVKSLNLGKNDELDLINKLNDLYVGNMAAARDTYYTVGFKEAVKLMIECIH